MKTAYLFLADGFEEVEALTVVDLLRRAGVKVTTSSIMGRQEVHGAHGITVLADVVFRPGVEEEFDAVILPGGQPGTNHLKANEDVKEFVRRCDCGGKLIAAICAAPMVLGSIGILQGRKATCYPGCEGEMKGAIYTKKAVERDGNLITGNGPGSAFAFALELVSYLCGDAKRDEVAASAQYQG